MAAAAPRRLASVAGDGSRCPRAVSLKSYSCVADSSSVHVEASGRSTTPTGSRSDADVVPGPIAADYRVPLSCEAGTATATTTATTTAEVGRALDPIRLDTDQSPHRPDEAAA